MYHLKVLLGLNAFLRDLAQLSHISWAWYWHQEIKLSVLACAGDWTRQFLLAWKGIHTHIYSNWHNETLVSVMGFGHYCFTNRKYSVWMLGLAGICLFGKIRIRIFLHPFGLDEVPWLQTLTSSQQNPFWVGYVGGVSPPAPQHPENTTGQTLWWRKHEATDQAAWGVGLEVLWVPYPYCEYCERFSNEPSGRGNACSDTGHSPPAHIGLKGVVQSSAINGGALKLSIRDALPHNNFLMWREASTVRYLFPIFSLCQMSLFFFFFLS